MEFGLKKRHTPLRPHAQVRRQLPTRRKMQAARATCVRRGSEKPTQRRHGMNSVRLCGSCRLESKAFAQTGQRNRPPRLAASTTGSISSAALIPTAPSRYCGCISGTFLPNALRVLRAHEMLVLAVWAHSTSSLSKYPD